MATWRAHARRTTFAATVGAALCGTSQAHAQENAAVVEQLFAEGKKLVAAGRIAEACPKFLASYNLEHRVGTLLNLADCYEQNHQVASAWARFVEARAFAARSDQTERAEFAAQHASALEARRSMLTIVAGPSVDGLVVKRDGVKVDPAALGIAVPVDGGTHALDVTAPGKVRVATSITVANESDRKTYTIPVLVDAEPGAATPGAPEPTAAASRGLSTRAIAGIAVAGTGVVMAAFGIGFGVAALGKNSDSAEYCGVGGAADQCHAAGTALRSAAISDATAADVLLGLGATAAIGGVVIWLTAPKSHPAATVGFDGRMLRVGGAF